MAVICTIYLNEFNICTYYDVNHDQICLRLDISNINEYTLMSVFVKVLCITFNVNTCIWSFLVWRKS